MFGGVLLNVGLNWILIFGNLGAPALGLAGAGWATLISRVVTFAALTWFVLAGSSAPVERWKPDLAWWREQAALLRLGVPTGLQLLGEVGAFSAAALLIGHLGAVPLAAHQIALTCASTTFMFPLGVAMASTVRIAQALGAGREDLLRPIGAGAWFVGLVVMSVFTVILVVAGPFIARGFVSDPAVIVIAAKLLIIAGIFQLVDGVQVVGSGLLRGLRDTKAPMWITIAAYWFIALPLGSWLAFGRGQGAAGMWVGLAWGLVFAAVLLVVRFVRKTRVV
jgi:MATE family multidrug resistance protein